MTIFSSLMHHADDMLRIESDPVRTEWWRGYKKGLHRTRYGARFVSQAEHEILLAALADDDPAHVALATGYAAGLTLKPAAPPGSASPGGGQADAEHVPGV